MLLKFLEVLCAILSLLRSFIELKKAADASGRTVRLFGALMWLSVAVAIICIASIPMLEMSQQNGLAPFRNFRVQFLRTTRGEQLRASLDDQFSAYAADSTALLNTDSQILLISTSAERRVILLKGEVLFKVAPDPNRPFVVSTPSLEARAVGTQFDVRLGSDQHSEVVVLEGKVRIQTYFYESRMSAIIRQLLRHEPPSQRESALLRRNQSVFVAPTGRVEPDHDATTVEQVREWADYRIAFKNTPIAQIAEELNRYQPRRRLRIADPKLGNCRMEIYPAMSVLDFDTFARAIEMAAGAKLYNDERDVWELRSPQRMGREICPR